MSWRSLDKINLFLSYSFEIWWCDMWVMLMSNYALVGISVLRFVIPEACTYSLSLCYDVGACFIFDCLPYEWWSGTSDGLFLPIYPPRGMRSSTLLWGLINFCNKYLISLWLMCVHGLYTFLHFCNLLASTLPCISLSHLESRCKLRRCIQTPWYDMLYHTKDLLYLPQNSHCTYLLWPFHSHSEIYCHATSTASVLMIWAFIVILLCMIFPCLVHFLISLLR